MMKLAQAVSGVVLVWALGGLALPGQTEATSQKVIPQKDEATTPVRASSPETRSSGPDMRVDTRPLQTFFLANVVQPNEANEILTSLRLMLEPAVKVYLEGPQNAILVRGTAEQLALAKRIIDELDRPKKTYRLLYTITETDGGKRIGVQHFAMPIVGGGRTSLKNGSKVPIVTGSTADGNSKPTTQMTYIDIGLNFDAGFDETGNGGRLRSKVEQSSMAETKSIAGVDEPVIRQAVLESTSMLTLGKPLVLGSLDLLGSTRHLEVEVVMEAIR